VTSSRGAGPRFYSDDPIWVDHDTLFDANGGKPIELSEAFDFLENTFGSPGSPGNNERVRALNVNTVDEIPDSSWFTNRIGRRPMSVAEIVRGPDKVERLEFPGRLPVDPKHLHKLKSAEKKVFRTYHRAVAAGHIEELRWTIWEPGRNRRRQSHRVQVTVGDGNPAPTPNVAKAE
jgi:hypothetical protein